MLGKLLKHEIKSYNLSGGIVLLSGLLITLFMKMVVMIPYQDEEIRTLIQMFGGYGYYYMIILMSWAVQILVLIRFYTTTVGDRGYLTWTLPAKTGQILWSKLIGGQIWQFVVIVAMLVMIVFFYSGNHWMYAEEVWSELGWIAEGIMETFDIAYLLPIFIGIVDVAIWAFVPMIMLYMCMAIGQLFGKWRLLASFGCYFGIVLLLQILYVVGLIVFSISIEALDFDMLENLEAVPAICLVLMGVGVVGVAIFAIFFAITNAIFKNKLNLE